MYLAELENSDQLCKVREVEMLMEFVGECVSSSLWLEIVTLSLVVPSAIFVVAVVVVVAVAVVTVAAVNIVVFADINFVCSGIEKDLCKSKNPLA